MLWKKKVMTAAEAQKQTQKQAQKRHLRLVEQEKKDLYKRILNSINLGRDHYRYNYIVTPDGELYPEVKGWLTSLGYKVTGSDMENEWIIYWN